MTFVRHFFSGGDERFIGDTADHVNICGCAVSGVTADPPFCPLARLWCWGAGLPAQAPALVEAWVTLTQPPFTVRVGGADVLAGVPLVIYVIVILVKIVIIGRVLVVTIVPVLIPAVALVPVVDTIGCQPRAVAIAGAP